VRGGGVKGARGQKVRRTNDAPELVCYTEGGGYTQIMWVEAFLILAGTKTLTQLLRLQLQTLAHRVHL